LKSKLGTLAIDLYQGVPLVAVAEIVAGWALLPSVPTPASISLDSLRTWRNVPEADP
jgi:hypothetical protein